MIYANLKRKEFYLTREFDKANNPEERLSLFKEIKETREQIAHQASLFDDILEFGEVDTNNHYDFEYIIESLRSHSLCYQWQTHKDVKDHHTIYLLSQKSL